MSEPISTPAPPDIGYEQSGSGAITWILAATFLASTALAVVFGVGYTRVMRYVATTLDHPADPLAWDQRAFSPDQCVDAAVSWTAECRGIKAMCDAYVDRVVALCMASQDRGAYCARVAEQAATTRFGYQECALRGVRRNVDAEACAATYRAIASYCETVEPPTEGSRP